MSKERCRSQAPFRTKIKSLKKILLARFLDKRITYFANFPNFGIKTFVRGSYGRGNKRGIISKIKKVCSSSWFAAKR